MISIYATTELIPQVENCIRKKDRLEELVSVVDMMQEKPPQSWYTIVVNADGIVNMVDWSNVSPPYQLPSSVPYTEDNLLIMIAARLQNMDWLNELSIDASLRKEVVNLYCLQNGMPVDLSQKDDWISICNNACLMHYGNLGREVTAGELDKIYQSSIDLAEGYEQKAFSVVQYASFLLDMHKTPEAIEQLLPIVEDERITDGARHRAKVLLNQAWQSELTVPYDEQLLLTIQANLNDCVVYYANQKWHLDEALLLIDGAHLASIKGRFTESQRFITRAIALLKEEGLDDMAADAELRKANLLYTWAQAGNPQFYGIALKEYQRCLKVYTKENAPDIYADIQHHMAILYVEMPKDEKKAGIWAGVANTAFQEALTFYTKDQYPYQYAMICNNFGNAVSKFPVTANTDNYAKAINLYTEALDVRDKSMPYERAITLLNYLEASWYTWEEDNGINQERYDDMLAKAKEVLELVDDEDMVREAKNNLTQLKELKAKYADHA